MSLANPSVSGLLNYIGTLCEGDRTSACGCEYCELWVKVQNLTRVWVERQAAALERREQDLQEQDLSAQRTESN